MTSKKRATIEYRVEGTLELENVPMGATEHCIVELARNALYKRGLALLGGAGEAEINITWIEDDCG